MVKRGIGGAGGAVEKAHCRNAEAAYLLEPGKLGTEFEV